MNALFAAYAWNASPIDGTNMIHLFAAKAQTFHFPLDIQIEDKIARIPQEGEAALQHIKTMFPCGGNRRNNYGYCQQRMQGATPRKSQQTQNEAKFPTR
jgi:hypothetical protein